MIGKWFIQNKGEEAWKVCNVDDLQFIRFTSHVLSPPPLARALDCPSMVPCLAVVFVLVRRQGGGGLNWQEGEYQMQCTHSTHVEHIPGLLRGPFQLISRLCAVGTYFAQTGPDTAKGI